ncbi:MAG: hypothetical protein M9944_08120 [Rhizobiaceae bacterium]|nr:hypothetical protein [Rhizobiaceae bacterium]
MTNANPAGARASGDPFHVYRPLLDLIGYTEGTDKGAGYNETLAYGAFTGGAVNLVGMTLDQVDALQTRMLRHPKNKLKSSAAGRYQIVRTTLRAIRKTLDLPATALYDEDLQDKLACFLLGQRGIDKYLAGRLSEDTMLLNLSREWASLPKPDGKGYYGGQHAAVSPDKVRAVLSEVRRRHREGQPKIEVAVEVDRPVVPEMVEEKVKEKTGLWQKITSVFGVGGFGGGLLYGVDWQTLAVIAGGAIVVLLLILLLRRQIVGAVKEIREGLA